MRADSEPPADLPSGMPEEEHVQLAAEILKMLADATRLRLLWLLSEQELSVNDLAVRITKPGPSVSQHLAKLRVARLVRTRREGNQIFYRVDDEHLVQLVRDAVYHAEHAAGGVPAHHLHQLTASQVAQMPQAGGERSQ